MKNPITDNIIISYILLMSIFFAVSIGKSIKFKVGYYCKSFKESNSLLYKIIGFMYFQILYILFIALVFIQHKYKIFIVLNSSQVLSTWLGMMSIYGIFLAFIQFIIGFAMQSKRDFYWGSSITKFLLLESLEYRFFNSKFFKLILVYISAYTIINLDILSSYIAIRGYNLLICDIFSASIAIVLITYIFLFIKCIKIKINLFSIYEGKDYYLKHSIENKYKSDFRTLFNEMINKGEYNYFYALQSVVRGAAKKHRSEMLFKIVTDSYTSFQFEYLYKRKRIQSNIKFSNYRIFERKTNVSAYRLNAEFMSLWKIIETEKIELPFIKLIRLYSEQEEVLYIIQKYNSDNYYQDFLNGMNGKNIADNFKLKEFRLPDFVFDKITNLDDVEILINAVEKSPVIRICNKLCSGDMQDLYSNELLDVENGYKYFFSRLLKKLNKMNMKSFDKKSLKYALRIFDNRVSGRYTLEPTIDLNSNKFEENDLSIIKENQVINYIMWIENTRKNKEFIKFITHPLKYEYIVAYVLYRMLYTGSEYYTWKKEVEFLNSISTKKYDYNNNYENISNFVFSFIEHSNIGHRIGKELLEFIFNNLNTVIDSRLLIYISNNRYIHLLTFLKIRYILKDSTYYDPSINDYKIVKEELSDHINFDWQYNIISSFHDEPAIFKIGYFRNHYIQFMYNIVHNRIPLSIFHDNRIQVFLIGFEFNSDIELFNLIYSIKDNHIVGNGIIDYLVLSLDNQKFYDYLISNVSFKSYFVSKVEKNLKYNNSNVNEYLNLLVEQTSLVDVKISLRVLEIVNERLLYLFK